jgi:F-type H+-transporting ATPase subunit b
MGLNPLEQLNLITMAAIAVIFLLTFFALKKVFFTPLIDVMEKRADKLMRAHTRYREANSLLEKAREEAKRIAAEAAETAAHLSEDVKGELTRIRDSKRAQTNAETEKILASGRVEVERLKATEQGRLKEHLLICSKQTLVKIIPTVDEEALRLVVNRVLTVKGAAKQP